MRLDQFMVATSSRGIGMGGKNAMTKTSARKASANWLTSKPKRPMSKRVGKRALLDIFRQTKHPMHTMYEIIRVPEPRETRLLNATVLPMLISDRRQENTRDVMIALTGTSSPGLTCSKISLH